MGMELLAYDTGNVTVANGTSHLQILVDINRAFTSVSLTGSLIVICCYIFFPNIRRFFVKLGFLLSVADIGQEIGVLMGKPDGGSPLCLTQSVFISYFTLATILWPFCIALTLFLIVVFRKNNIERMEIPYHIFCWGLPALFTGLPFITNSYGDAGILCWIDGTGVGDWWRFGGVYGWLWLVFLVNSVLYIIICCRVRKVAQYVSGLNGHHGAELTRLSMYPLILFVCYLFASIDRIQNWLDPPNPIFWLQAVHIGLVGACGTGNAIAFLTTPAVRVEVLTMLRRCGLCGGFSKEERIAEEFRQQSFGAPLLASEMTEVKFGDMKVAIISQSLQQL